ncbi:uncharacterized protein LOC111056391 isoform X2 [Nilaparvata lugens]|uniref:uncharacterized protein LOC111056391 isoform X2 n=1 Tax=Nilaparvata lugens TaxID=108931 RepID=UPI00193E33B6|nr:uncharacterized protein LOC111056391 isoform X2 [Nilaparvata lugens]
MSSLEEDVLICSAVCIVLGNLLKKNRAKPRVWVRPFLKNRESTKEFVEELKIDPLSGFKNFTRISCHDFEYLLGKIGPIIAKRDTNYRQCVSEQLRLVITLRYLATGDSFVSLMYLFKVSRQLISRIVPEVCYALISTLKEVIKTREILRCFRTASINGVLPYCKQQMIFLSTQVYVKQAKVTAGGFFDLNRSVAISMLLTGATYLLLCYQSRFEIANMLDAYGNFLNDFSIKKGKIIEMITPDL